MNVRQKNRYLSSLHRTPPYPHYKSFHWADYIELLCIANLDGELSCKDIVDRLTERNDLEVVIPNNDGGDIIEVDNEMGSRNAENVDKLDNEVNDLFQLLKVRSTFYGKAYPFIIQGNEIRKKKGKFTKQQKLYIYLLLCANLYLFDFDRRLKGILANCFEVICFSALKKILPTHATTHLFGSNPLNKEGRYGIHLSFWEKINLLADDICAKLHPEMDKRNYPVTHRGDDGLDIVAWISTGEQNSNSLLFLAQCACSPEEWKKKQSESSYDAWSNKIIFTTYTNNVMFIPFCFRGADGNWFRVGDIWKSFLLDRKRIIFYLENEYREFDILPAASIVEKILTVKEGIV